MRITIDYFLYTDGDYKLKHLQKFKCLQKNVELNDQLYDYVGSVDFEDDEWKCKHEAKEFLWKFLCDGIRVSYTHHWIIKDFYKIIEKLEKVIDEFTFGIVVVSEGLFGNYEGTKIRVIMSS